MRLRLKPWIVSVAIHALFVAGLLILPGRLPKRERPPKPVDIVFYQVPVDEFTPPQPKVIPPKPKPEPKPEPKPKPKPKPRRKTTPKPAAPEPVVVAQARPVAEPEPTPVPRPKPRPKPRAKPSVGSFGTSTVATRQPEPRARSLKPRGFSGEVSPTTLKTEPRRTVAAGNFAAEEAKPRVAPTPQRDTTVASGGFSGEAADAPRTTARPTTTVQRGGFGDEEAPAAEPRRRLPSPANPDTPVSILSKPKPIYTDVAREKRVEGEVVLEVRFAANGKIVVLRVVSGLGHGLDEAAIAAARNIEFKPASRDGAPVDETATLRVVFQLA
ncbi:MAG: energy transducer TonB [Acidobacteriota bacterium]|nr:energy transducer TonB [Acidobacteriota bacterium]MDH3784028.1 energy transducer TonB [Acidobacteriota bacterium]